jgi:hypothetical protein
VGVGERFEQAFCIAWGTGRTRAVSQLLPTARSACRGRACCRRSSVDGLASHPRQGQRLLEPGLKSALLGAMRRQARILPAATGPDSMHVPASSTPSPRHPGEGFRVLYPYVVFQMRCDPRSLSLRPERSRCFSQRWIPRTLLCTRSSHAWGKIPAHGRSPPVPERVEDDLELVGPSQCHCAQSTRSDCGMRRHAFHVGRLS